MNTTLFSFYKDRVDTLASQIQHLRNKNKAFIAAELITFLLAIALVAAFTAVAAVGTWALFLAALSLVFYVGIRRKDVKNSRRIERMEDLKRVYEKEVEYLHGDFSSFDDGERYADPKHAYTFDMDVFGPKSLYHRLCRTVTSGGADRLAEIFRTCALSAETGSETVNRRREAIDELSEHESWRAEFLSHGQSERINTASVLKTFETMTHTPVPRLFQTSVALVLAWLTVLGFWISALCSACGMVGASLPVWWGILQFVVVFLLTSGPLRHISHGVGQLHKQLKSYISLMRMMVGLRLSAPDNKALIATLTGSGNDALRSFAEMEKILDGFDRRGNVLGMFLWNVLFLSDLFLVRRFLRWQSRYMNDIPAWIEAVNEMDARVSMSTFRYNEPHGVAAEVVDADSVVYEAEGLCHPFLGENAVRNDFTLADRNYYIVTGANMAGKSTFLRSIGVNYILAMAGMPVFAAKLRLSVFALFSSMRTSDDLAGGVSYFNAELLRLKQLIESCKRSRRTLIILDEILKGTNSLDKLNGSRMFLEAISVLPVTGVIATHDLELSKMADVHPTRFHNYCFEIRLSDEITYTYKITPGVARNQNATYLLKGIISSI